MDMDMISCLICPFFKKYFFQKCPQNLGNFKKRLILFCISSGIFIGLLYHSFLHQNSFISNMILSIFCLISYGPHCRLLFVCNIMSELRTFVSADRTLLGQFFCSLGIVMDASYISAAVASTYSQLYSTSSL